MPSESGWGWRGALAGAALAAVACNTRQASPPDPPAPTVAPEPRTLRQPVELPEPDPLALPHHVSTTVLEAGAEPRAALRYALGAGTRTYLTDTALTSRELAGTKWDKPVRLPRIRNGFAVTAVADRAAPLALRPLAAEVAGERTPAVDRYLATWRQIEDRRLTLALDDHGRAGALAFGDDPGAARSAAQLDELHQRLLATTVPVPAEPVGAGATWRVVTILRQRPAIVKQTATYTLVSRDARGWKVAVELHRVGETQTVTDPDIPRDLEVELIALVRRMTGTLAVDPARPFPTGTLAVESTLHLRMRAKSGASGERILEDTGTIELTAK